MLIGNRLRPTKLSVSILKMIKAQLFFKIFLFYLEVKKYWAQLRASRKICMIKKEG